MNFSQSNSISGTLWWPTQGQFLLFSFLFFGLGKCVYVFYHYRRGALYHRIMQCNKGPIPFSREAIGLHHTPFFLISREASEKYPHIVGRLVKNTPFSGFSRENLPETNGQKYPLSRENGNTHACMRPLVHSSGGWAWMTHLAVKKYPVTLHVSDLIHSIPHVIFFFLGGGGGQKPH